jgi:ATP/maltotriose-dependent transcriptional regulator MalT
MSMQPGSAHSGWLDPAVASLIVNDQSRKATGGAAASRGSRAAEAGATSLEAGQLALAQGRFDDSRRAFEAALREEETPEAHEGLAFATMWHDAGAGIASLEDAHRLYLERDDRRGAGRVALWLAHGYGSLAQPSVASGWGERAIRLLDGLTPGPEHAWLASGLALMALGRGETQEARRLGCEAAEIARRIARPDLEAMGLALEGRAFVAEGEVAAGMRLLDEATATAIGSGTADFSCVGQTCCTMLAACELTGDIGRASEWCERTTEYARRYRFRALFAVCRTSYARVLIWRGRWEEAEAELLRADREFAAIRPRARGQAIVHLAELRRRQGRLADAAELFAEVEGSRAALLGSAALALDRGDSERGHDLAERYLRQTPPSDRAERAIALELLVRAGVERSATDGVEHALDELRSIAAVAPTEHLQALASSAAGSIAAAGGAPDQARRLFEDAVDLFNRCGAPFESAGARLALARALRQSGRRSAGREEAQAARTAFARLGATHGLELAARLLAGLEDEAEDGASPAPGLDLTARELEVLRLLAAGLTNREIAARLVISEHTVHRHVTNLYRSLGVSSRTAATAYAHRHGLA